LIDDTLTLAINVAAYFDRETNPGWYLYISRFYEAKISLVLRLDTENKSIKDFLLIAGGSVSHCRFCLTDEKLRQLGAVRHESLAQIAAEILDLNTLEPLIPSS
jgi:hypothetical protein